MADVSEPDKPGKAPESSLVETKAVDEQMDDRGGQEGDDEEEEGDEDGSDEEESDDEPVELMVQTREKRMTAGNRMRDLLADETLVEQDERFKEEANDDDFAFKEEKDVFDSDFGSTDEEAEEAAIAAAHKDDEDDSGSRKKKRKTAQAFIPTFAKQTKQSLKKRQSEPGEHPSSSPPKKRKKESMFGPTRESTRTSAQLLKQSVAARMKEADEKRAQKAPKPKKAARVLTQADLIAEALETEEINRASLLAFYAAEEDRRALERQARKRAEVVGPKLTWISKTIGQSSVPRQPKETDEERGRKRLIQVIGESGKEGWKPDLPEDVRSQVESAQTKQATATTTAASTTQRSVASTSASTAAVGVHASTANQNVPPSSSPSLLGAQPQPYTRNFVFLSEVPRDRQEQYKALFGPHSKWEKLPKSAFKTRRVPTICPITGRVVRYRDPETMTPYANLYAYRTIKDVVKHKFVWNDTLGAYTGQEGLGCQVDLARRWASASNNYAVATVKRYTPTVPGSKGSSSKAADNPYAVTYTSSAANRRKSGGPSDSPAPAASSSLAAPLQKPAIQAPNQRPPTAAVQPQVPTSSTLTKPAVAPRASLPALTKPPTAAAPPSSAQSGPPPSVL